MQAEKRKLVLIFFLIFTNIVLSFLIYSKTHLKSVYYKKEIIEKSVEGRAKYYAIAYLCVKNQGYAKVYSTHVECMSNSEKFFDFLKDLSTLNVSYTIDKLEIGKDAYIKYKYFFYADIK